MEIKIAPSIVKKLEQKHGVSTEEVEQCFWNRRGELLEDTLAEHKTDPPTYWFIAETDKRRKLRVVLVWGGGDKDIHIKTAFDADEDAIRFYKKHAF